MVNKAITMLAVFAALFFGISSLSHAANGYGTSSISTSQSSISIQSGSSSSLSYSVSLASGNTWGTTLDVVNNGQLASQGIMVSLSNPSGDPTYSGTMSIAVGSSTAAGIYPITLQATGDDPSQSNATVMLTVTPQTASNTSTIGSTIATTSLSTIHCCMASYVGNPTLFYMFIIGIIVVIIGMVIAMVAKKSPISRLIILGVALILIGVLVWLYGDYSGGNYALIWGGVALIAIGMIVWLMGDKKGHLI